MNTIIVLTETPVWHQGYIKHHLRNPGINITGSQRLFKSCLGYEHVPVHHEKQQGRISGSCVDKIVTNYQQYIYRQ